MAKLIYFIHKICSPGIDTMLGTVNWVIPKSSFRIVSSTLTGITWTAIVVNFLYWNSQNKFLEIDRILSQANKAGGWILPLTFLHLHQFSLIFPTFWQDPIEAIFEYLDYFFTNISFQPSLNFSNHSKTYIR